MKRLLLSQLPHESERSSNIVSGNVIFALYVLERHAPSQASHHDGDRYAGPRMTGLPWKTAGSRTIRFGTVMVCQMIMIWLNLSSATTR